MLKFIWERPVASEFITQIPFSMGPNIADLDGPLFPSLKCKVYVLYARNSMRYSMLLSVAVVVLEIVPT